MKDYFHICGAIFFPVLKIACLHQDVDFLCLILFAVGFLCFLVGKGLKSDEPYPLTEQLRGFR